MFAVIASTQLPLSSASPADRSFSGASDGLGPRLFHTAYRGFVNGAPWSTLASICGRLQSRPAGGLLPRQRKNHMARKPVGGAQRAPINLPQHGRFAAIPTRREVDHRSARGWSFASWMWETAAIFEGRASNLVGRCWIGADSPFKPCEDQRGHGCGLGLQGPISLAARRRLTGGP